MLSQHAESGGLAECLENRPRRKAGERRFVGVAYPKYPPIRAFSWSRINVA